MNVLALNCGSSSLKFQVFASDRDALPASVRRLAHGLVERIGDAATLAFQSAPASEVERWLNERAGLLGLSGRSRDMRDLLAHEQHDPRARLAVEVFCHRARKYLGAYLAILGGADAVVFSGGIGEHAPEVRRRRPRGSWAGRGASVPGTGHGRLTGPGVRWHSHPLSAHEFALLAMESARGIRVALLKRARGGAPDAPG